MEEVIKKQAVLAWAKPNERSLTKTSNEVRTHGSFNIKHTASRKLGFRQASELEIQRDYAEIYGYRIRGSRTSCPTIRRRRDGGIRQFQRRTCGMEFYSH